MERLWFEGPNWNGHFHEIHDALGQGIQDFVWVRERSIDWKYWHLGHGGDEYGNCSYYIRTPLFGIVWFPPTGHFQRDVEMPDLGESPWVDRVFYNEIGDEE